MNEHLKQRINRHLDDLDDARGYQLLDFIEFMQSKYGARAGRRGLFTTLTETAEDTMRAAGVPLKAISGTMGVVESAGKVMRGVAAAAQAVVDEAVKAGNTVAPPKKAPTPPPSPASPP